MNSISTLNCLNSGYNNCSFKKNENKVSETQTKNAKKPDNTSISGVDLPGTKRLNMPPVAIAAANALCWFSVGFVLDKLFSLFSHSKETSKTSLIINSAIGAAGGIYSYIQAKKASKKV